MKKVTIFIVVFALIPLAFGCENNSLKKEYYYISQIKNIRDYKNYFSNKFSSGFKLDDGTYSFNIFETFKVDNNLYKVHSEYYLDLIFESNNLIGKINSSKFIQNVEIEGNDKTIERYILQIDDRKFSEHLYICEDVVSKYGYIYDANFVFPFFDFYNYLSSIEKLCHDDSKMNECIIISNSEKNLNMLLTHKESYANFSLNFDNDLFSSLAINISIKDNPYINFIPGMGYKDFENLYNTYGSNLIIPLLSKYSDLSKNSEYYNASAYFKKADTKIITIDDFDNPQVFENSWLIVDGGINV